MADAVEFCQGSCKSSNSLKHYGRIRLGNTKCGRLERCQHMEKKCVKNGSKIRS